MVKSKPSQVEPAVAKLLVPRSSAQERIESQITKGKNLLARDIKSKSDFEQIEADQKRWHDFNVELLSRIFSSSAITDKYSRSASAIMMILDGPNLHRDLQNLKEKIGERLNRLESIKERLELIEESGSILHTNQLNPAIADKNQNEVFVVHGHDDSALQQVCRFLEKLRLMPVVLHEQPNAGRTVIEKFEDHSKVSFAVILLTPDDMGSAQAETKMLKPRARQNVIFELGFFMGRLGRKGVCALYKEGVEIPSDFSGVLYIPMDVHGGWKSLLGRELKQAGLQLDMNNIF